MRLFHFWRPAPMHYHPLGPSLPPSSHSPRKAAQENKHMVILIQEGGATELNSAMHFCSAEAGNTHQSRLLERALEGFSPSF